MYNSQSGSYEATNSLAMTYGKPDAIKQKGMAYAIFGWMFTAISFVFVPFLFGTLGLLMGFLTFQERSRAHGIILMFFAGSGLVLGSLLSFFVAGTLFV